MSVQIDPRGPRFGAGITTGVLAVALVTSGSPLSSILILIQATAFGLGAFVGLAAQPYGVIYRQLVAPRLAPPTELEDSRPPRFAQAVGFGFALVAIIGLGLGSSAVVQTAVAFALAAAFLNAAFGLCLGCEMYLLIARVSARSATAK